MTYPQPAKPPYGHILIINNKTFEPFLDQNGKIKYDKEGNVVRLNDRHGSDNDVAQLKATFESFFFEVTVETNLTKFQMETSIRNFLLNTGMVAIILMSHGSNDEIVGTDNCYLSIGEEVLPMMSNAECDHLKSKFKLLVVNACRGKLGEKLRIQKRRDMTIEAEDDDGPGEQTDQLEYSDILVLYSTQKRYASLRNKKEGSWFVQALCEVLADKRLTNEKGIHAVLAKVVKILAGKPLDKGSKSSKIQGFEYRALGMSQDYKFPRREES